MSNDFWEDDAKPIATQNQPKQIQSGGFWEDDAKPIKATAESKSSFWEDDAKPIDKQTPKPSEVKKPSIDINAPQLISDALSKAKGAVENIVLDRGFGVGGASSVVGRSLGNNPEKAKQILDVIPNAAAGVASGTLGMSESIYRTPEMLGRGVNALGETLSYLTQNPKIKETVKNFNALDPETGVITRGIEAFGKKWGGTSDVADSIHVANEILPKLGGAFERNQKLALEADEGFNELVSKGNPKKLLNTILNPSAWAGFIGQAAPSLATAIASGGSMAFMGWLEAAGSANDIADYEKKMGKSVTGADAVNSMAQAGIINAYLEKAGVMPYLKKFQSKAKPVVDKLSMKIFKMMANAAKEGTTESLQEVNSNLASMNYDKTLTLEDLRKGVAASFLGGFGAGGAMDIALEIYSKSDQQGESKGDLPEDVKKPETKQIATEEDLKEPVKTEAIKEAEKVGKVVGIDAETKLPIIDTKQETEKPKEVTNVPQEGAPAKEPSKSKPKKKAAPKTVFKVENEAFTEDEAKAIWPEYDGTSPNILIADEMHKEIKSGEAGRRWSNMTEDGTRVSGSEPSTFPDYFKDKGYTKKEALSIIEKYMAGEGLTQRQQDIFKDLFSGKIEQIKAEVERAREQERASAEEAANSGASPEEIRGETEIAEDGEGDTSFNPDEFTTEPTSESRPAQEAGQPAEIIDLKESKVVDKSGKPIVVYHGTAQQFSKFKTDPLERESFSGLGETAIGAHFSESKEIASAYPFRDRGDNQSIISAKLNIKNPKKFTTLNALRSALIEFMKKENLSYNSSDRLMNAQRFKDYLESLGYDGIVFKEGAPNNTTKDKANVWVAFNDSQIIREPDAVQKSENLTIEPDKAPAKNLDLKFEGRFYPVASKEEAVEIWNRVRDEAIQTGLDPSNMKEAPFITDSTGKTIAHITWNGTVKDGPAIVQNDTQSLIPGTEKPTYRKPKFGEVRELPEQKTEATDLQAKANEEKQAKFTEEEKPSKKTATELLSDHKDRLKARYKGAITAKELQEYVQELVDNEAAIKEEIAKKSIKELTGQSSVSGYNKKQIVDRVYNRMISGMVGSFAYDPFSEKWNAAAVRRSKEITDDEIQKDAKEVRDNMDKRNKSLENPETYEEFSYFVSRKGVDALTTEQKIKWDELQAEVIGAARQREESKKEVVKGVALENTEFSLSEEKHSKTGEDLFVVKMNNRVSSEQFKELAQKARMLGGNYSRFSRGFLFREKAKAEKFMALKEGDVSRKEDIDARKGEVKNNAVDRLRDMADSMEAEANASLNQDRRTNTARQLSMAQGAEAQAQADIALAKTMRKIADAIEAGQAKRLEGLRTRAQVEELLNILARSKQKTIRLKNDGRMPSRELERPIELADIENAEWPTPGIHFSTLRDLIKEMGTTQGYINDAKKAQKLWDAYAKKDAAWIELPKERYGVRDSIINLAKGAAKKNSWAGKRLMETLQPEKRLEAMDITSLPELRAALRELFQIKVDKVAADSIKTEEAELRLEQGGDFYTTPESVVERLLDAADIKMGESVLEPSAGLGNIADALKEAAPSVDLTVNEFNPKRATFLKKKGFPKVENEDFLEMQGQYDKIVMNPPFSMEKEHIRKAYEMLKPGGRLVSVMSSGPFFRSFKADKEFRDWFDSLGGEKTDLEQGAFKESGTGVNTVMVVLDKPSVASEGDKEYLANQAADGYDSLGQEGDRAYGSKENYKRIQSKNIENVRGNNGGIWRPSQAIRAIYNSLRKRGFAPLIGHKAETAQELAEIASVFRNPRNEIFQVILTKEGKVVAHHAITQNIPTEVGNAYEFSIQMKEKMRLIGADSIYVAHNHPSGDPSPSREDRQLTRAIERQFGEEYGGHLILNGNEFAVIFPGGSESRFEYSKPKPDYALKSKSILSANEMAEYARLNFKENKVSIIFLNSQNQVLAIEYVRPEVKFGETIANKVNGNMASQYVVVTANEAMAEAINNQRLPENIFDIIVLNNKGYISYNKSKKLVTDGKTRFNSFLGSKADTALFSQEYAYEQKTTKVSESKMGYTGGAQPQGDIKETTERYYQDFINRFASIENAAQDALKSGAVMLPGKNPALLARSYLGVAGKVQAMIEKGVFKINDAGKIEIIGSSLKEAIETFDRESIERDGAKRQEDLNKYLIARRTIEDLQRPAQGSEENIVSPEQVAEAKKDIDDLIKKYKNLGLLFQTANKIYAFQRNVLSLLVDSGVMDNKTYTKILAMNPNYVPFDRIMDDENSSFMPKSKDRFTKARSPIRKIKGSEREIHDVLESIIKNTFKIVDTAERNKVAKSIAGLKDVLSDRIKPIKIKMMPIQLTEEEAGEETTIFRPSQFMPKGRVIEYFVDGKRKYMEVSKNLYDAMTGLNETGLGIMSKILSFPANILRVGATITPEFISRNLIRDQLTAFMQTRFGYVPFIDAAGAVADIMKKKDAYYDWLRTGGSYSGFIELSRKEMGKKVNELRNNPSLLKKLNIVTSLQDLSQLIEQSSRVGVYKAAKKTGRSDLEAGFESREGTLDFGRRGSKTKDVNAVIAFFNAGVQGIDKSIRSAKDDPIGFTIKGIAAITIPQIIFYLLNRDDEDYKEVPQWQKDLFFVFRLQGMEEFIRIPKPFLYGQVFGSFVERALTAIDKKEPKAFDGFAKVLFESALPVQGDPAVGLIPTALKPIIENSANYNFFRQMNIVPEWKKGLPAWQQYDTRTSETAKTIGRVINKSPAMIENAIFGYLGGSGKYLLQTGDLILTKGGSLSMSEPQDIPISKGFVTQKAYVSSESVNDFYDNADRIEGAYLGFRQAKKEGNQSDADKILKDNPDMRLYSAINKSKKLMSELNAVMYSTADKERKKWAGEKRIDLAKRINALVEKTISESRLS